MSKNILNNQESFTRTKKKLKKLLEDKGLKLTLCETSDILSKALGFKNTFDIQKVFNEEQSYQEINNQNSISKKESPWSNSPLKFIKLNGEELYLDSSKNIDNLPLRKQNFNIEKENINGVTNININLYIPYGEYRPDFSDELIDNLEKILVGVKGHVIITGKAGTGKTTLMRTLKKKKKMISFGDINNIEYDHEEEVFSYQHLELIKNSGKNIIFCIHEGMDHKGIDMLNLINNNFNINTIQYIIKINLIKEKNIDMDIIDVNQKEVFDILSKPSTGIRIITGKTKDGMSSHVNLSGKSGNGKNLELRKKIEELSKQNNVESYHIMDDGNIIKEGKVVEASFKKPYKIEDVPKINIKNNKKK